MSTDEGGRGHAKSSRASGLKNLRLLVAELRKALGDDRITTMRRPAPDADATTTEPTPQPPPEVAPRTPSEVATILGRATALGVPIHFAGAAIGRPAGLALDLSRLEHLLDLDLPSRLVTLQVGTKVNALEERVRKESLSLPGLPDGYLGDERLLAFALASGRLEDRPLQQACIGLSAALPTGELVHVRPSPRRATGPDFMTFFLGKGFRFGVIVTVTMRLRAMGVNVATAPARTATTAVARDPKAIARAHELALAISRKVDPSGILV